MKSVLTRTLKTIALLAVLLVITEIALRVLTPYPITRAKPRKVYDRDFGYRLNQDHPATNKSGYRKIGGIAKKTVAAIGDGLTYGGAVEAEVSWPAQFQQITGAGTSNFGIGSYGAYTYYAVGRHAISKGYKYVIIALQVQNDFTSTGTACAIDYKNSLIWKDAVTRLSLKLPDCKLKETWRTVYAPRFIQNMHGRGNFATLQAMKYGLPGPPANKVYKPKDNGKASASHVRPSPPRARAASVTPSVPPQKRPASHYFSEGGLKLTKRDIPHSDLEKPVTKKIVGDFEKLILDLKTIADENSAKIGVLLLQPKPQIIFEYADDKDTFEHVPWMRALAEQHRVLEERLSAYMTRHGIPWRTARAEILEALSKSDRGGGRVYGSGGGHPFPAGYRAYARAAAELYERMMKE